MASNEITMRRTTKTIAASLLLACTTLTVGAQEVLVGKISVK